MFSACSFLYGYHQDNLGMLCLSAPQLAPRTMSHKVSNCAQHALALAQTQKQMTTLRVTLLLMLQQ